MSEEKLPKGWKFKSLNDLNSGKSKNVDPARFPEKTFELYSVPQFEFSEPEYLKGSEVKSTKQKVEVGDVLISKINPRINRVWVVEDFSDHEKIASSEWIIVRPKDFIDPKYLKYAASAPFFRSLLQSEVSGVGGSLTRARPKIVANYRIPVAPLPEQQRIVARLDAVFGHLDRMREKLDRIPELLKNFRQQVLTQAVTGELTRDWREGKGLEDWGELPLSELIVEKPRNGYSPKAVEFETEVKSLTLSATTKGYFDPTYVKYLDIKKPEIDSHLWLKNGDILIQRSNSLDYVGTAAIYYGEDNDFIYPDLMMKLRANDKIETQYLFYVLSSNSTKEYFKKNASGTAGNMPKINQGTVMNTPIPYPSLEEQDIVIDKVSSLFGLADKIESQYQSLKAKIDQMPQAVLAKAFRGELVVQEVKEYVSEIGELGMVAEGVENYQKPETK